MGICFDGDRALFVDENGKWISPDLITGLLGLYYFKHFPEKKDGADGVLYDARSTNSIKEYISKLGGKTYICSTGHTAMQVGLTFKSGIYGGELPGHYYYRDFFNLDNGWIPFFQVRALVSLEKRNLSDLINALNNYFFSGEMNFAIPDGEYAIEQIKNCYFSGRQTFFDGVRVDFDDWWFLVRMANTEPVMRLVVEGRIREILDKHVEELKKLIYRLGGSDHLSQEGMK